MATVPSENSAFSSNMSLLFGDRTEIPDQSPPLNLTRYETGPAIGHTEHMDVSLNVGLSQVHAVQSAQPATQYSPHAAQSLFPEGHLGTIEEEDSLDQGDIALSQDIVQGGGSSSSVSSADSSEMSETNSVISFSELHALFPPNESSNHFDLSSSESGSALCEDLHSRIFYNFDDELYTRCVWADVLEEQNRVLHTAVSQNELYERTEAQQEGGLLNWSYDSPFCGVTVRIDDVNDVLERRFLVEANSVLNNVIADIASKASRTTQPSHENITITPLSCVQTFLSDCLLEKLRCFANRALHQQGRKSTTANKLLGLVILHTLCASYNESPTTVGDERESENFFQIGLSSKRYHEVWAALSGSKDRLSAHNYSATGWWRSANRTTSMITEVEAETAAINRELLYIPNGTVLSLDDNHLRMGSRAVTELTYLQQHNNPKKGLGPVGTAMYSALNPFVIACHLTRTGEKLWHTWERLMLLLQGAYTTGALRPMPDAIIAAYRGYNSKESIAFVSNVLGASVIGTHKRDLWFLYVFGDGPISRRHRGMVVSEKGCGAVYSARLKGSASNRHMRAVEACLYRESCSGRNAAMVHNNASLFPSRCFTVVLKEIFRSPDAIVRVEDSLQVYGESRENLREGQRETRATRMRSTANVAVDQFLRRFTVLTYLQSEDPVWFLLRAFRFTSRTGHSFLSAIAREFDKHMKGLASKLAGIRMTAGADMLPVDISDAQQCVRERWDSLMHVLGLRKQVLTQPNSRRYLSQQIARYSASKINSLNMTELQRLLGDFERQPDARAPKAQLVAALLQTQSDIRNGTINLEGTTDELRPEAELLVEAENVVCEALREASVGAWVMKPLVTTMGMREGSRNEIEILKALREFLLRQEAAYARPFGSSVFVKDSGRRCVIRHMRCVGLVESKSTSNIADSSEAVIAATDEDDTIVVMPVEVKTMTSISTVGAATDLKEKYGAFLCIENVGVDESSNELFQEMVPTTQYRAQVLHHAVTLGVNHVMFVVGTGGSMTEGRIVYVCNIQFSEQFRHKYTYALDCVRIAAFEWIGGEAKYIPKEFDNHLKNTHASDIHGFMSYYNLSQALRKSVIERGSPIPPSRIIRLSPTVYWNHLKGGVDVMSRYMKTIARSNISENPVVSIVGRLLSMQVSNAVVAYRLYQARRRNLLPRPEDVEDQGRRGYFYFRHRLSQSETFGRFVRMLARQWVESKQAVGGTHAGSERQNSKLKPLFCRDAASRYNLGPHKARRLNSTIDHTRIVAQPTYCVLCSWALCGTKNGKPKVKRKGSRQVQWCQTCRQAVCSICWTDWHTKDRLKRAEPSAAQVRDFERR